MVLVTGVAGFIGYHVAARLLDRGVSVCGVDNLNPYYDVNLKVARLALLEGRPGFTFLELDISDRSAMEKLFSGLPVETVIHLAAQAGVRYSIHNPHAYADSNLVGFLNVLEGCRHNDVRHLVYASSSSVYGANTTYPFSVQDNVDHPVSFYAATKKANELMAHTYSHLYGIPTTGLRLFTVYGPWGRPDMAVFKFTEAILKDEQIDVYNFGDMYRDFTYIDDIVEGILRVADRPAKCESDESKNMGERSSSSAPYRIYNIGNNQPVRLLDFIEELGRCLGHSVNMSLVPMQPGDVWKTAADVSDLKKDVGFAPSTPIGVGLSRFVEWYRDFYEIRGGKS